uniref:Uncharacterized protein n=1 Tax=Tanacetum cinerariifolium TaxID=118510 RepID=A0A6L2LA74_TANCI|nr:hypothetical protein [Tanacetum cinerariifolium]
MAKKVPESIEMNKKGHDEIILNLESKVKALTREAKRRATRTKIRVCKAIFTKDGLPLYLYTPFYYSPEEIKYFSANSSFLDEEIQEEIKEEKEIEEVTAHHKTAPFIDPNIFAYEIYVQESWEEIDCRYGDGHEFWASCNPYDDQCDGGNFPNNTEKKCYWCCLNDDKRLVVAWERMSFKDWIRVSGTVKDEADLDGIVDARLRKFRGVTVDYLELKSQDGFIDIDDESYKERMCKLLGMTYKKPSPILIEKVEITRYTIGAGESYTKVRVLEIDEMPMTSANIGAIRAELMKEIDTGGSVQGETSLQLRNGSSQSSWLVDMLKTVVIDINYDMVIVTTT